MPRTWTPEQKAAQAEKIRKWKPWENSTGPKTEAGKARAKMNAYTGGVYTQDWRLLRYALKLDRAFTRSLVVWWEAEQRRDAIKAYKTLRERTINDPP